MEEGEEGELKGMDVRAVVGDSRRDRETQMERRGKGRSGCLRKRGKKKRRRTMTQNRMAAAREGL